MSVSISEKDNYSIVTVSAEKLDTRNAPDLKAELVVLDKTDKHHVIVDLSQVKLCDSSGLSALLIGNRIAKAKNAAFVVNGLQPAVQNLIKITKLDAVLTIVPTLEEAEDFIKMEIIEKQL